MTDVDSNFYGLADKLSECCLEPINDFGFCSGCLEHAE